MGDYEGALAINCSGTVQMCWSTAALSDDGSWADYGGLVGTLNGGSVINSYVSGSMSGFCAHGLVGYYKSGTVANNLFTAGDQACGYKVDSSFGSKISVDELKTQVSVDKLNTDVPATGFTWSAQGGLPVLISGGAAAVVNKDALKLRLTMPAPRSRAATRPRAGPSSLRPL